MPRQVRLDIPDLIHHVILRPRLFDSDTGFETNNWLNGWEEPILPVLWACLKTAIRHLTVDDPQQAGNGFLGDGVQLSAQGG
jgi:hypothetical protein